jgi:uncharacterized damage-inducible protein DinB
MKDDFASLYTYNRWADRRILGACRKLTAEQYVAEPAPGWSSVRATLVHLAIVTEGWLRGLTGEVVGAPPSEAEFATVDDAERLLERAYQTLDGLLPALTPERLAAPMTLRGGGRSAVLPPWAVLRHVVNHATYHRGQIAAKLKRLGVEAPATDFIFWALEQMPQMT